MDAHDQGLMATFSASQAETSRGVWPLASTTLECLQPLALVLLVQLAAMRLVRGLDPIHFCNGHLFGIVFGLET